MARFLLLVLPLFFACGSSQPADSADDASDSEGYDEEELAADMGRGESASGEQTESKPSSAKASSAPVEASSADLQKILQLVLDDDALHPYLLREDPARIPLKVSGDMLPSGLELTMARKPVKFVDATVAQDKKNAVLVFTEIEVTADRATVAYRYDIEKMKGTATVVKSEGAWSLQTSRVSERDYKPSADR